MVNGEEKYLAILVGDNGYIVTAHPIREFEDIVLFE